MNTTKYNNLNNHLMTSLMGVYMDNKIESNLAIKMMNNRYYYLDNLIKSLKMCFNDV